MGDSKIQIIGVDVCNAKGIETSILNKCKTVVISKRIYKQLGHLHAQLETKNQIPIAPVDQSFEKIEKALAFGDVAVFASGDPLFFGIARKIISRFGRDNVDIAPALSSVQHTCSAFKIPWDDADFISLHGRKNGVPVGRLVSHEKVMLLTDNICRPDVIAHDLNQFLGPGRSSRYQVYIAENIGMEDERFVKTSLQKAARMTFGSLCCMILERTRKPGNTICFGLQEEDIYHSRGLITKNEVRASVLHSLALEHDSIMWDVGAGSGSVSIECARLVTDMVVYAVEKEEEQLENISLNIDKYDLFNIQCVKGAAPSPLYNLPTPDRVFIGGSGGNLPEIIEYCTHSLAPDGRIVISAVLEKTRNEAPRLLHGKGFEVEMKTISVTRCAYPEPDERVFNPITIIVGKNRKGNESV